MEKTLYSFNSSQDVIRLQTKYSLFGRVANIVFSTTVDDGFDKAIMTKAINCLFERNDCLRITFVKKKGETMQYFEDSRTIGEIPYKVFKTNADKRKFLNSFRRNGLKVFKGEVLKVVYATEVDGKQSVYFKVSHYVADTYAIGVLVGDLFAVYDALKNGKELPAAPARFEDVLKKDLAYKANDELKAKDEEFFKDYYEVRHREHPMFTPLNGDGCDRLLKQKRKGSFSMPYLFVRCDTEGYHFVIPAAVGAKVKQWCQEKQIPLSEFYFYTCNLAASIVNHKTEKTLALMLLDCRGTMTERKAGGTKVQAISVYSTIDYEKSFSEQLSAAYADQNELYKHTRLTYLEVEAIQHKLWNFSMAHQLAFCSFSFIPSGTPKGIHFMVHSNGKGALVAYIALMASQDTDEITVVYDVQKLMISPEQLADFQSTYVHVIEAVLDNPDAKLGEIL